MAERVYAHDDSDDVQTLGLHGTSALTAPCSPPGVSETLGKTGTKMISTDPDCTSENNIDLVQTGFTPVASSEQSLSASPPLSSTCLPNFLRVPVRETAITNTKLSTVAQSTATASAAATKARDEVVAVKTENDIKGYVESTMNELLGWYGLSKMDNSETSSLTMGDFSMSQHTPSRPASVTTTSPVNAQPNDSSNNSNRSCRRSKAQCENSKPSSDTNNNSSSCGADDEDDNDDIDVEDKDVCEVDFHQSFTSANDVSGLISPEPDGGEVPDCERGVPIICSWCQHPGNKLFTLETPAGVKSFCNEVCFTQCRRASFKRNKVCEWCKHVRHTLNFVDFQDGDVQLQFCSEKCLNQYKMDVFCTEARQHLQQIQDLSGEQAKNALGSGKGGNQQKEILITPEMWLSAQASNKVAIKQEVSEVDQVKIQDIGYDNESKTHLDGMEPGEVQDTVSRWTKGVEMNVRVGLSDHINCSNDNKVHQKVKSPLMSRQKKDKATSRPTASKTGAKTIPDSCHYQDRERIRKLLTGTILNDQSQQDHSPGTSTVKEKADSHLNINTRKNVSLQSALSASSFNPQQVSPLPLLPNWATSQLFTMMPSHLNPAFAAANISSSLGNLGYASNPLLYSSLFGPTSFAVTAQKELASSGLAKSKSQSRQELLRDRSLEAERVNIRAESTERSTRSTSSSYSSSDTPGPSSTPGATITTGPEPGFVPGFSQQIPLHTNDLSQPLPLPHYLTDPTVAGMFPLTYNLNHSQRVAASQVPPAPHMPAPAASQVPPQHSIPPVTILVPYPVAVPIPIPIPIPIPLPIAPEKLFAFLRDKSAQTKSEANPSSTQQWSSDHRSTSSMEGRSRTSSTSHTIDTSPVVSPNLSTNSMTFGRHPFVSSVPLIKSPDPTLILPSGRDSLDSFMRREAAGQQKINPASQCTSSGFKHASTSHFTHDRSKKARLEYHPFSSEDEAIDLSKLSSRSSTPRASGNCSEKENATLVKQESFSDSDVDCSSQTSNTAPTTTPRIHIISDQIDRSLCPSSIALPISSQQSSYSGRRSRILDAPSVPKKMRSPSPERRYIRTVPRDMVEAARRRGLRARVRTK